MENCSLYPSAIVRSTQGFALHSFHRSMHCESGFRGVVIVGPMGAAILAVSIGLAVEARLCLSFSGAFAPSAGVGTVAECSGISFTIVAQWRPLVAFEKIGRDLCGIEPLVSPMIAGGPSRTPCVRWLMILTLVGCLCCFLLLFFVTQNFIGTQNIFETATGETQTFTFE